MNVTMRLIRRQQAEFGNLDPVGLLNDSLARFQHRLRHVCVYVEDVNGPRGGRDKQCRCVLHLKRQPPIVIQDQDDNLRSLMRRITERAVFALSQRLGRRTSRTRQRRAAREGKLFGEC